MSPPFPSPSSLDYPMALIFLNSFSIFTPTYPSRISTNKSSLLPSPPLDSAPLTTPLPPSPSPSLGTSLLSDLFTSSDPEDHDAAGHEPGERSDAESKSESRRGRDGQDDAVEVDATKLNVEDREMMAELMALKASKAACDMAAQIVLLIIPALPKNSGHDAQTRKAAAEALAVGRALFLWSTLSASPLIVLVATIILLERLIELHPKMGNAEVVSRDAPLQVTFAAFLLALKFTADTSYTNRSLAHYTPWKLVDVNAMEKELLKYLGWDLWISSQELLHRASGFWEQHQHRQNPLSSSSSSSTPSHNAGHLPVTSNLFLMHRRTGLTERGWRGGLVRGSGESGKRIPREGTSLGEEGRVEETTVWRRGRLERREGSDEYGRM